MSTSTLLDEYEIDADAADLATEDLETEESNLSPIEQLWVLRSFVHRGGTNQFIGDYEYELSAVAKALGLRAFDKYADKQAIATAIGQLHRKAEKKWGQARATGILQSNVQKLAQLLHLSEVDCQILEFAICLHLNSSLASALALGSLKSSIQKPPHICSQLLALSMTTVEAALGKNGRLHQTGLLKVSDYSFDPEFHSKFELINREFAARMTQPDLVVTDLLHGTVDAAPAGHLQLDDYSHIQTQLDVLLPYLRSSMACGKKGVNVLIYGYTGTGKTQLTRALGQALGAQPMEIASADDDGDSITGSSRLQAFRLAQSLLPAQRSLLVFDEVEDVFVDHSRGMRDESAQSRKAWMNSLLEGNALPTLWLCNSIASLDHAFIRRFDMVMELPIPPKQQRTRILQNCCGDLLDAPTISRVAELEKLAPAMATRAAAVLRQVQGDLPASLAPASAFGLLINGTLKAQKHKTWKASAAPALPDVYDPAFIQTDNDVQTLAAGLQAAPAARICFYGAPGTGKTAYARWLAEALGKPLLVKRASDLLSMFVGGTEQLIAEAFEQAQADDAVLLIDEVDSFLQDRREAKRSWETTQVNEMLTQMEAFEGIFIASTNLLHGLDAAALRRFDMKVKFDYLKPEQSWALLQRHCSQLGWPAPHDALRTRLRILPSVALGDFALAMRRHRFTPFSAAEDLVAALEAECALKEGGKAPLGFLA